MTEKKSTPRARTPRYDRWTDRKKEAEFWKSGMIRSYEGLPRISAYNPVAWLLRQRVSFYGAVQLWKAQPRDRGTLLDELVGLSGDQVAAHVDLFDREQRRKRFAHVKAEYAKAICRATGRHRDDYAGAAAAIGRLISEARNKLRSAEDERRRAVIAEAETKLQELARSFWRDLVPLTQAVTELERCAPPLLEAYRNPRRFFRTLAPKLYGDFALEQWDWQGLAQALHTWGDAALINPKVRRAFDAVSRSPRHFNEVLAWIEQRKTHDDGRPKSGDRKIQKDTLRRFEHLTERLRRDRQDKGNSLRGAKGTVQEYLAHDEGVKPSAIQKRIAFARKIKSSR